MYSTLHRMLCKDTRKQQFFLFLDQFVQNDSFRNFAVKLLTSRYKMPGLNDYFGALRERFFSTKNRLEGIAFIDVEVGIQDKRPHDFGAFIEPNKELHTSSKQEFSDFILNSKFLCGHNIIHHDLRYLANLSGTRNKTAIDTLYLSPLLFPKQPYHKLLKDDKLQTDELNNPLNDCLKARTLFYDEINAFGNLPNPLKTIYFLLLNKVDEFAGFFDYIKFSATSRDIASLIFSYFNDKICTHAPVNSLINEHPVELAYALALISTSDQSSITPLWLMRNFPYIENIMVLLCNTPCHDPNCQHCENQLNIRNSLQKTFGYDDFRTFDGEPLQEKSVQAAVDGHSLLSIFPTGGGKSLAFQLPAIMAGQTMHGLTVVISPLQSLMKDQVDNLAERGITDVVTINGLLDPISRADAFDRVASGKASLLYIAPEMLRSKTIESVLLSRNVVRFVIDEAHCFSSWGQDFRVDYLYIGDFIRKLQEAKKQSVPIPISCFTATAKQKVISDIRDYFKRKLDLELELFASASARKNLKYDVIYAETEDEKYNILRNLMIGNPCPTIVYVSRTRKSTELAQRLTHDGIKALPFNGKMDPNEKIANQNDFIANRVMAMVATSAFGMGVDKKDVGMVIHYDISDSLENYVQEAGRAGRDPKSEAKCYVLYNDNDLDKHFLLLSQTKVSISEIQQVWKAIKDFTKTNKKTYCSALEIARQAGWSDSGNDVETRVRTAIAALEEAGYITRGNNVPHVFATGILVRNMDEARNSIEHSPLFTNNQERENAIRIIKSLISSKAKSIAADDDAESRIDYLADRLGMTKASVINAVNAMRQGGILADSRDMTASIEHSSIKAKQILERFATLEHFLLTTVSTGINDLSYKELNEKASKNNIVSTIKDLKTLLSFLAIKSYIKKNDDAYRDSIQATLCPDENLALQKHNRRLNICRFIIDRFYQIAFQAPKSPDHPIEVIPFSVTSLVNEWNGNERQNMFGTNGNCSIEEVEEALLYLSKIGAIKLEGGFLVLYNTMELLRLKGMKFRYTKDDYRMLDEFYKQKKQQIHIVGEYANMMVRDYSAALQYVQDYFQMDYKKFIATYFKGERLREIDRNISPAQYQRLFGTLSEKQRQIIDDNQSKYIVVAAGPGSGKTKVLVHKLASLLMLEDVKHEQLLMLTFSRAAATEFKHRLIDLIGSAASFVEIKTFHAFSFDILGKMGNLDEIDNVVSEAAQLIERGEADQGRINKTVLVIDEAQDMNQDEYALVKALMQNNEEMRLIAVGDDDQNIYEFRGSDSRFMQAFITEMNASKYEMTENYRSCPSIVSFANQFATRITSRLKVTPCTSKQTESGKVQITQYTSNCLDIPVVNQLLSTYQNESACVLTNTNSDAARITGLLIQKGIRAKLIQSTDGFRVINLAEMRYFLKLINQHQSSPVIDEEDWEQAKSQTLNKYQNSTCVAYLKTFFNIFESINPKKYHNDLFEFLLESNIEDFCISESGTVLVSTIHKSKGREFDTVYMMLNGELADTNERIRKLYVGMTRAKHNLYIHVNTQIFPQDPNNNYIYNFDSNNYPFPEMITLQLGMRDVYLDFFKDKKEQVFKLVAGDPLTYNNGYLCTNDDVVIVALSKQQRDELRNWSENGYSVYSARVNFIVAWKGKNDEKETAVVLPELTLRKTD